MPRIKDNARPYRFFFYSFDCNEAKHIHVRQENMISKFWLEPVELCSNHRFSPRELTTIRNEIRSSLAKIIEAWDEHCN
jgi:Domain of unknown function (DUF4160)